jgi:hypothetical protein
LLFIRGDFPDFGHETKYAPFGMLGKPEFVMRPLGGYAFSSEVRAIL